MEGIVAVDNRAASSYTPLMLSIILIQATNYCNMKCSYCYLTNLTDSAIMPPDVLDTILVKVLRSRLVSKHLTINWHLGEPMAARLPFYEAAVQAVRRHNRHQVTVRHTIQTNGTLITDEWCRFFKAHDFGIGISVDGPAWLHDEHRKSWGGQGTHHRTMRGVERLGRHGIDYAGLCVLTSKALDHPDEIYHFFVDHGFRTLAFNVEEVESANLRSSLNDHTSGRVSERARTRYRAFMSRVFDLWVADGQRIYIREFGQTLNSIRHKVNDAGFYRNSGMTGLGILSFKRNGDISAFSPELAGGTTDDPHLFTVGNIDAIDEIEDLLLSPRFREIQQEIHRGLKACARMCHYFDLCGGGFSANKYFENGTFDSTETTFCILHRQVLADVALEKLASHFPSPLRAEEQPR